MDYKRHINSINRNLILLTGIIIKHVEDKDAARRAGEIIEEIQDTDLVNLEAAVKVAGNG